MKIGINLLFVRPGKVGGSEPYMVNLVKALLKEDKKNKYFLIVSRNNKKIFKIKSENAQYLEVNLNNSSRAKRIFFEQIFLPKKLKNKNIDLLIATGNTALLRPPCKTLLIVFDLIYFVYPKYYSFLKRIYLHKLVKYSCEKADRIATISENTKNDIVKYFNINSKKIDSIFGGINTENFSKIKKEEAEKFVEKKYGIKKFIFSPTPLWPHKNNDLLVKIFSQLKKEKKIPQKLIITGVDPYNRKKLLEKIISEEKLENEVFYLGRVSGKDLPYLYSAADLLMYLSSYEGFGLPILEAMSSGCPTIVSNRSSLPEVTGNAGILVNPLNKKEVVEKSWKILSDTELRNSLIKMGLERSKEFSWQKVAKRLMGNYKYL